MYIRLWPEYQAAYRRCCSDYERDRCMDAWGRKFDAETDASMQRHGLPGMKWPINGGGRASF